MGPATAGLLRYLSGATLFDRHGIMLSMVANWTQLVLGIWILISPWLLGFANISLMKWSNLLAGLIIILMNAWIIVGEKSLALPGGKK